MKGFMPTFAFVITAGSMPWAFADDAVTAAVPAHQAAQLTVDPELESATDTSAIIRWTTINPGGTTLHYGVVHYGTDANEPDSGRTVAQSPQSFASRYDFPRAHHGTQFEYHLLLQGGIHRRHRRKRWSVQFCENIQDTVALRKAGERAIPPSQSPPGRRVPAPAARAPSRVGAAASPPRRCDRGGIRPPG